MYNTVINRYDSHEAVRFDKSPNKKVTLLIGKFFLFQSSTRGTINVAVLLAECIY